MDCITRLSMFHQSFSKYWNSAAVGTWPFARKWEHAATAALSSGTAGWHLDQHHVKQHYV